MKRRTDGRRWGAAVLIAVATLAGGCQTTSAGTRSEPLVFEPALIEGDLEFERLNDEELFAVGTAAFGAEDWAQAARAFDRIADFHPESRHAASSRFNAGLSFERLEAWDEALERYQRLADPARGTGDALDATYRSATMLYQLGRLDEAAALLDVLVQREDLPAAQRLQALVERGVCEKDAGRLEVAEKTLREVLSRHEALEAADDAPDVYFAAQAQFHLAEIYRTHFQAVQLDPAKGVKQLSQDLEYKSQLLLSAQGHYLRCIRLGHGEWATAASAQVGGLYEALWDEMSQAPTPPDLTVEEASVYRSELRKKIRVLISKSINVYERTLETAVRIGAKNPYIERTRASLERMKDLLVAETHAEQAEEDGAASPAEGAEEDAGGPGSNRLTGSPASSPG